MRTNNNAFNDTEEIFTNDKPSHDSTTPPICLLLFG